MKHILLAVIAFLFYACQKKKAAAACTDDTGLYQLSSFPIGVAVNPDSLFYSATYNAIVSKQFNSLTPENIFKASFLHPSEHYFDWYNADLLADYAVSQNKRLHGHTLIWHNQLPGWIQNFSGSAEEWEQLFKDHIQTIVKHFAGKAHSWDVVNEAFNDDGTLRQTIWKEHLGTDYIEKAFRYAHEADPDALLFYNDYSLELNPTKRSSVISYLNNLRLRGVQIDGIGIQCHITIAYPDLSQIADALKNVADNNYLVHLSELDISIDPFEKGVRPTSGLFSTQADILSAIVVNYKQLPEKYQYGITLWGLSDNNSWQSRHYPLVYDTTYHSKPAYCKLKETL